MSISKDFHASAARANARRMGKRGSVSDNWRREHAVAADKAHKQVADGRTENNKTKVDVTALANEIFKNNANLHWHAPGIVPENPTDGYTYLISKTGNTARTFENGSWREWQVGSDS